MAQLKSLFSGHLTEYLGGDTLMISLFYKNFFYNGGPTIF